MHSIYCCVNFLSPLSLWSPFQTYPIVVNEWSRLAILSRSTLGNSFPFTPTENGVQSQVTDCEIRGGRSGTADGFSLKCLRFPLLIIIPPILHTHLSPPSALRASPDQTAHYHIFCLPILSLHLWPHTWLVTEAWSSSFILRTLSLFLQFISHLIQHSCKHILPKVLLLTVLCLLNTPYHAP